MTSCVGIDGFRLGWVGVWLKDTGEQRFDYSSNLPGLLNAPFSMAMIDMPIGLPDHGHRACDREARSLLGPAVFPGVRRNYWNFENQSQANKHYWENEEPGISAQLWAIRKKVREVDEFMTPARQHNLRETHPELIFFRLNNNVRLPNKKTAEGRQRRIEILTTHGFTSIEQWLLQRKGTGIGRDDLIDACACALVARRPSKKLPVAPTPVDTRGLLMEMWF